MEDEGEWSEEERESKGEKKAGKVELKRGDTQGSSQFSQRYQLFLSFSFILE